MLPPLFGKKALRPETDGDDDHQENEDGSQHVVADAAQQRRGFPDEQRADSGSGERRDAADHGSHEGIDQVRPAHERRNAFHRRGKRPGKTGKAAAERKRERVDARRVDAEALRHGAVLRHGADALPNFVFFSSSTVPARHGRRKRDGENVVIGNDDFAERDLPLHGDGDILRLRAENKVRRLLEHDRNAESGEHGFRRPSGQPSDDQDFHQRAGGRRRRKRSRQRSPEAETRRSA